MTYVWTIEVIHDTGQRKFYSQELVAVVEINNVLRWVEEHHPGARQMYATDKMMKWRIKPDVYIYAREEEMWRPDE